MLERTLIYVDTSYLLASFYNAWETGARAQLEIDLPEVVNVLESRVVDQLRQPVYRQNWYDGLPDSGPHRYQRALRSCNGVQLRSGQLIEWGDRRTQKAVDTRLVADMVISAMSREVTDIVLVSGDADMLPGVEEAVSRGVRVHLYGFGWDSMSANLRYSCDSTTILDPREDFADCMRLQILEGPLKTGAAGAQHKPIGDAEPVEDLSGTCAVPDVRRRPAAPAAGATGNQGDTDSDTGTDSTTDAAPSPASMPNRDPSLSQITDHAPAAVSHENPVSPAADGDDDDENAGDAGDAATTGGSDASAPPASPADLAASRPTPAMMAPRRRLRSRYVPLPTEVWQSGGQQNPFDIGEQYAVWWFQHAATTEQQDGAHVLCGGGLPPEVDRPLLQFACETLHEYTLTEYQRVNLRDGFHSGIRGILLNR
ncbi:NYN domain-containing protein [Corynebacterium sp. CNJ-954]|uniref:NYN domain-containing protein n=1 Tax=Corynebacterium sp. CNJ-954 TaxID=1904962 RepID=UPI0009694AF1|nr:NYN domain-containing protein [Corynebacterium sp. CNJ-954]OLT55175.1 NYN domain-containing protein [Corynebacterium sp. CNJ-954]